MYKIEYANYNHYLCYVISVSLQETQIKKFSPAGNRTPVSRVTGGDTNHYTTEDRLDCVMLWQATVRRNEARQGHNFVMCACLMTSYSKVSTWWTLLTHDETPCTVLNCRKEKAIKKWGFGALAEMLHHFCQSGCFSVWNNSTPTGRIFMKFDIFRSFENQILLKLDKNNGYFT